MKKRDRKFRFKVTQGEVVKYFISGSREGAVKLFCGKQQIPKLYVDKTGTVHPFGDIETECLERVY